MARGTGMIGTKEKGYDIICNCLLESCQGAFEQGYLSWGDPVQGPPTIRESTIEEYFEAEKARRRGIGFACFRVELMKIGMIPLRSTHISHEPFFGQLGYKLQSNPKEGDIISLAMFIQSADMDRSYWNGTRWISGHWSDGWSQSYDHRTEWAANARSLAGSDCVLNGRLRCHLLVSPF